MDYFLELFMGGLTRGSIYALIALGYTMVYGIIELINFAHGEIYMIGAFTALIVSSVLTFYGFSEPAVLLLAFVVAVFYSAAYGFTVEKMAYKPLRQAPRLSPLISAIGMSIFLQNYVMLAQTSEFLPFPNLFPEWSFLRSGEWLGPSEAAIIATTAVIMIFLTFFIKFTRLGKAMRATAQDRTMALLVGVNVNRTIAATFIIGSALAAVGGILIASHAGRINFFIGFSAGIKAFTAAVLGGIGSIPGAVLGGLLLGWAESFATGYISSDYEDAFSFALLVLILIVMGAFSQIRQSLIISCWFMFLTFPIMVIRVNAIEQVIDWRWMNMVYVGAGSFALSFVWRYFLKHRKTGDPETSSHARLALRRDWLRTFREDARFYRPALILMSLAAVIFPFLPFASTYQINIVANALLYVMLGLGLNIVVGLAGLLHLGYVAFYAVGAYSFALLHYHFGIGFWTALPIGALMATLFGVLLGFPVLRLRGDYLAIVTLAFGEITRLVLENWNEFSFGPGGIANIPRPGLWGADLSLHETTIYIYFLLVVLCFLTVFVVFRLKNSRIGRAWVALREDEIASEAMGVNTTAAKLSAFALGSTWAGLAGVIFAAKSTFINPACFTFLESAMILAIVVLGGMGSILGVVIGAFVLILLPEYLRTFSEYRMLLFGTIMVLMMIFRPQGLVGARRQVYEYRPQERKESTVF